MLRKPGGIWERNKGSCVASALRFTRPGQEEGTEKIAWRRAGTGRDAERRGGLQWKRDGRGVIKKLG